MLESQDLHSRDALWDDIASLLRGLGDDAGEQSLSTLDSSGLGIMADDPTPVTGSTGSDACLAEAQSSLYAAFDDVSTTFENCRSLVDSQRSIQVSVSAWHDETLLSIESVQGHLGEVRTGLISLDDDIGHASHSFHDQATATGATIEGVSQDVHGRHAQEAHGAFHALIEAIEARGRTALDQAFSGIDEQVAGAFDHLEQDVQSHAGTMEAFVTRVMLESAEHIAHDTLEEVRQGFQDLLHHGVEVMVVEVAAQAVTMGVGSTVTVALAPLLPELVLARAALRAINFFLDLFD